MKCFNWLFVVLLSAPIVACASPFYVMPAGRVRDLVRVLDNQTVTYPRQVWGPAGDIAYTLGMRRDQKQIAVALWGWELLPEARAIVYNRHNQYPGYPDPRFVSRLLDLPGVEEVGVMENMIFVSVDLSAGAIAAQILDILRQELSPRGRIFPLSREVELYDSRGNYKPYPRVMG